MLTPIAREIALEFHLVRSSIFLYKIISNLKLQINDHIHLSSQMAQQNLCRSTNI
jgi:hypothetical protein